MLNWYSLDFQKPNQLTARAEDIFNTRDIFPTKDHPFDQAGKDPELSVQSHPSNPGL